MGPALLVSPLLALMRNQIAAAERMGARAETINSDNSTRWREVEEAIRRDEVDIVLIAPERFANDRFNEQVLSQIGGRVSLLVVDEARCISDWGHDFRPDYRRIERTLRVLPPNLRLLATTATANNRVMDDLREILGPIREIEAAVNVSHGRIRKTIQLLALESPAPIAPLGAKWQLTAARLSEAFWERTERLTELRRAEQQQMQQYVDLSSGHMEFLIRSLDGDPGDFQPPDVPDLPATVQPASVRDAIAFLRNASLSIEPRKKWPNDKWIERNHRAQPGKALCVWGDAGWGRLVSEGKYRDRRFADDLVKACAALVREWQPVPHPAWVTSVPSHRRPHLLPDFAKRLALALQLPFREVLERKADRPEQKTMENSDKQARNVIGSLAVDRGQVLQGPVLLVDDMVDSRWTFTVVAWELRRRGSGEVWPLALADAGATR